MQGTLPVSKDILSEALLKYQIKRIKRTYPSVLYCNKMFHPNERTEEKINKLIKLEKKPYYIFINTIGKRVACFVAALFIIMIATVFSTEALREPFVSFAVKTYKKFSTIIFNEPKTPSGDSHIMTDFYEPAYIPNGYAKNYGEVSPLSYFCEYTDNNGNSFLFEQYELTNTQTNIDTENAVVEKIYINGLEGVYFGKKSICNILFSDGQYSFFISGTLSKEEIIRVAESIKKIN
ncbi:MAG TPA: DUF4367 domain-containing protein [Oscillospiraceae bacterium]|nr:DUF4367 domain-containing protein [Oscillospiraceae bacterium]